MSDEREPDAPENVDLEDEAIEWIVHLRSGRATVADRRAFAAWRRRSAAHEAAAQGAESLWDGIGQTAAAAAKASRDDAPAPSSASFRGRRAFLGAALAATVAFLAVGIGILVGPFHAIGADHATATGERRSINLADGSIAQLNSASALSVEFGDQRRRITLHTGEAHFDVAHQADRPFEIRAGSARVLALGTAFSVRRLENGARVVVSESAVKLEGPNRHTGVRVAAGNAATWRADAGIDGPHRVDAAAETAWTRGKLIFNRQPLANVVAELERHYSGRLVVLDRALARREVSGVFPLGEPDAGLEILNDSLGARLVQLPYLTLIY